MRRRRALALRPCAKAASTTCSGKLGGTVRGCSACRCASVAACQRIQRLRAWMFLGPKCMLRGLQVYLSVSGII